MHAPRLLLTAHCLPVFPTQPHTPYAARLQQVLDGPCCTRPGSCALLTACLPSAHPLQVLDGPCCTRPGSCASLRTGLDGFESLGRDLCNTGQNLCDVEGRLVHLALVNEASTDSYSCICCLVVRERSKRGYSLCDVEGRLVHLALVNEASTASYCCKLQFCCCWRK